MYPNWLERSLDLAGQRFTSLDFEPLFRSLRGRRKKGEVGGRGRKVRKRGKEKGAPLSPNPPSFFPSSPSSPSPFRRLLRRLLFRACLNGGGEPQVGELTLSAGVKSCYVHASKWGRVTRVAAVGFVLDQICCWSTNCLCRRLCTITKKWHYYTLNSLSLFSSVKSLKLILEISVTYCQISQLSAGR